MTIGADVVLLHLRPYTCSYRVLTQSLTDGKLRHRGGR